MSMKIVPYSVILLAALLLTACQNLLLEPIPAGDSVEAATVTPTMLEVVKPAEASPTLSTPALLGQAVTQGEITENERLLYLAYAVYEPDSLPAQFRSNAGWRGTEFVREVRQAVNSTDILCAMDPATQDELRRLLQGGVLCD
ncbi:MAG: hypothetical protein KDD78_14615 [Caldilineaceae bacterium]|nr:hypothetical protein [Caldilineaceae bacterium]